MYQAAQSIDCAATTTVRLRSVGQHLAAWGSPGVGSTGIAEKVLLACGVRLPMSESRLLQGSSYLIWCGSWATICEMMPNSCHFGKRDFQSFYRQTSPVLPAINYICSMQMNTAVYRGSTLPNASPQSLMGRRLFPRQRYSSSCNNEQCAQSWRVQGGNQLLSQLTVRPCCIAKIPFIHKTLIQGCKVVVCCTPLHHSL